MWHKEPTGGTADQLIANGTGHLTTQTVFACPSSTVIVTPSSIQELPEALATSHEKHNLTVAASDSPNLEVTSIPRAVP